MEGCWGLFKMHMTFKKSIKHSSSIKGCHSLKCLPTEVVYLNLLAIQWPCTVRGAECLPWPNLHFIYGVGVKIMLVNLKLRMWCAKYIELERVKWAGVEGRKHFRWLQGKRKSSMAQQYFEKTQMGARGLKNHSEINLVDVWVRACLLILAIMYRRADRESQQ